MKRYFFFTIFLLFVCCGEPTLNQEHKRKICKTLYDIIQEQQANKFDSIRLRKATDSVIIANGFSKLEFIDEMKTLGKNREDLKAVLDTVGKMQEKNIK